MVLEQPGGGTPALNVMAIRDQRHANVSQQRTLLADADVSMECVMMLAVYTTVEKEFRTIVFLIFDALC